MLKKHQLLERAMRDYPAKTVARFESAPGVDHISDGTFKIFEDTHNGICVVNMKDTDCFYTSKSDQWAIPVSAKNAHTEKPSILVGDNQVQIKNRKEYELMMDYRERRGWGFSKEDALKWHYPMYISLKDSTVQSIFPAKDQHIFSFKDFAKEAQIEVPIIVLKSEDGIPLYTGDRYHEAYLSDGEWIYLHGNEHYFDKAFKNHRVIACPKESKAFYSKDAAKKWVEEQNRPKQIVLHKDSDFPAYITKDQVFYKAPPHYCTIRNNGMITSGKELEEIYAAYKSLQ